MSLMSDVKEWLKEELAVPEAEGILVDTPEYPEAWKDKGKKLAAQKVKFKFAVQFAKEAHKGVTRKGTTIPYVLHPVEAALIVLGMTDDIETVVAAVLHDVVEDTKYEEEDIKLLFGERVAALVAFESEDKMKNKPAAESWKERKEATLRHLGGLPTAAKMVCLGDKLSNIRMSVRTHAAKGDAMWADFNQKDPKLQAWYYDSIGEELSELKAYKELQEYKACCDKVFGSVREKQN